MTGANVICWVDVNGKGQRGLVGRRDFKTILSVIWHMSGKTLGNKLGKRQQRINLVRVPIGRVGKVATLSTRRENRIRVKKLLVFADLSLTFVSEK